ncbi:MAG: phosphoribosylglycinamide formyltransferase [Cyanobacteriota bacterium]
MSYKNITYRLGILASGNGSNLQAIIDAIKNSTIPDTQIVVVISNNRKAYALERAKLENIDHYYLNYKEYNSKQGYDQKICNIMTSYNVDLIILAGYLRIVSSPLLTVFNKRILNIHPSLLPDYGGVNMYGIKIHETVIANGEKYSGCTVHIVTEEVDKGPILNQIRISVDRNDTPQTLAKRILKYEHQIYPNTIREYLKKLNKE